MVAVVSMMDAKSAIDEMTAPPPQPSPLEKGEGLKISFPFRGKNLPSR